MRRALAMGVLLWVTGCEEVEPFLPSVAFERLAIETIDFDGAEVDFVFAVNNPNPVEIGVSSFSYALDLAQTPLLAGSDEEGFQLEATGTNELRLPVALRWRDTWEVVQATRGEDRIDFGLSGHFGFDTPMGETQLPYRNEGSFPALRTPAFRLVALRTVRLDLANPLQPMAKLELDVSVDNDHGSALLFEGFTYGIALQGRTLSTGSVDGFAVEGATTDALTLPIDVDLLTAGAALYQAIVGGGAVQVDLEAGMDVETPFGLLPLSIEESETLHLAGS